MVKNILYVVTCVLLISACNGNAKKTLGLVDSAPNEYMVQPRASLSIPPEYNLRPVVQVEAVSVEKVEGFSVGEQALTDVIK